MSRQRMTQRAAKTFGKTADIYLMNNEDRKQPSATDYINGDPSSWAEDVRPAPKPGTERDPVNGLPLIQESNYSHKNSDDWGDDGKPYDNMNPRIAHENARTAMRQVHADLSRNASLSLRIAEIMLSKAPAHIVEAQALDLMSMSHKQIQATLERLAGQDMSEDEDEDESTDAGQDDADEEEIEEASKKKKASKKPVAKKSKKASDDEDEDDSKDAAKKSAEEDEDEDESKEASEDEDEDEDESKNASEDEDEDDVEEASKKAGISPEKLRTFMATFKELKAENARLASQVKAAKAANVAKVASEEDEIERDLDALLQEHEASEDALDMGMLGEDASMDDSLDAMMEGDDLMDGILFDEDTSDDMEDPFFMSEASPKTAARKPVQSLNQVTKTATKVADEIRDLQKLWASDPQID